MYTRKMAANFNFAQVLVLVVVAAGAVGKTFAATYVVGDSVGWTIPSGGASTYSTWASQHTFRVGDILVFNFPSGVHDVATVPKASFDGCTSSNPISLVTVGPASITLASAGAVYYICTFGQHCSLGQKLAINVTGGAPTSPPAAAPSPRTTPPPSPTPSPTPAPPTVAPTPSAPTPAPTPSAPTPAPTPSAPTPAPTPSSSPAPTPGEAQTPPSTSPSPGGAGGGGGAGSPPVPTPAGTLSPPPPPNSASATATATFLAVLAVTFVTSLVC